MGSRADYMDGLSECDHNASDYNDDQLAKNLARLFKADRNSLMLDLSANAIQAYLRETNQIHNDSTSITFLGEYAQEDSQAVKLKHGFNKDHRPDCKQIVFGLNITADGNVPLSFELFDGNRTDDTTHIPNWNALREFLGKEDFLYIADCKVSSEKKKIEDPANAEKMLRQEPLPQNLPDDAQKHDSKNPTCLSCSSSGPASSPRIRQRVLYS